MIECKIMLYNMHHGAGIDGKPNLERIVQLVRQIGVDVVGFNEVDRFFSKRSGFVDQFAWFCQQLGMECAFGASITRKKGAVLREYGNCLFSRFPIVSHRNHGLRARGLAISEPRALLEAEIDLGDNGRAKLFLTHLSIVRMLRRIQTNLIVQRIAGETGPVILMGDLNMTPGSGTWNQLAGVLTDVTQKVHGTALNTFPSIRPCTQKDYIFTSDAIGIQSVETDTQDRLASDHLPLVAALTVHALAKTD